MPERSKTQPETYSIPELRPRGWTKTLIERFLGQPDAMRPNPHYRRAAPMKLYLRQRVGATEGFRIALRATQFRQISARKAVVTKTALTLKRASLLL